MDPANAHQQRNAADKASRARQRLERRLAHALAARDRVEERIRALRQDLAGLEP